MRSCGAPHRSEGCRRASTDPLWGYDRRVRRTALTLIAAALTCVAVTVAVAADHDTGRAAVDVASAHKAAVPKPYSYDGLTVGSPTRKVLAEMNRRLGTPRRVLRAARRRRAEILRLQRKLAKLRAEQRAA